jgi:large subunit ribosomal protein L35e
MEKKLRVFKLRNKTEEDLTKGLEGLKKELSELRVAKVSGGTATKLGRIRVNNIFLKSRL